MTTPEALLNQSPDDNAYQSPDPLIANNITANHHAHPSASAQSEPRGCGGHAEGQACRQLCSTGRGSHERSGRCPDCDEGAFVGNGRCPQCNGTGIYPPPQEEAAIIQKLFE